MTDPALTPEEWDRVRNIVAVSVPEPGRQVIEVAERAGVVDRPEALAAIALIGRYTWNDIDELLSAAGELSWSEPDRDEDAPGWYTTLRSIAVRLAQMLPPRDDGANDVVGFLMHQTAVGQLRWICGIVTEQHGQYEEEPHGLHLVPGVCDDHNWGGDSLGYPIAEWADDYGLRNRPVRLRYWVTDHPMTRDELIGAHARMVVGATEVMYDLAYSETTGWLWLEENFKVGGHDILARLRSELGRFVFVEVEVQ